MFNQVDTDGSQLIDRDEMKEFVMSLLKSRNQPNDPSKTQTEKDKQMEEEKAKRKKAFKDFLASKKLMSNL